MKIFRAILAGTIVWVLIFFTFTTMSFIPVLKDSEVLQFMMLYFIIIPIAILGAKFYYKKGTSTNGLIIGLIIVITALSLDAIITVPFLVIPNNGSYLEFFANPLLLILAIEIIIIVYLYWKLKVKKQHAK